MAATAEEVDAARRLPAADPALTGAIRAGSESAFAQFYELWFAPSLALARACCRRDEAFCLDVVQDVMVVVARRMPKLDDAAQVRSWMASTILNACRDRIRSESRRRRREQQRAEQAQADAAHGQAVAEPWAQLARQERRDWLEQRMSELSEQEQALLVARFGGAANVTAVAEQLGMTADAAHGRLRRALGKLRQKAASGFWRSGREAAK
ncbi:MAG: RNA polymerase sigma factor [Planctomycetota bacterium]